VTAAIATERMDLVLLPADLLRLIERGLANAGAEQGRRGASRHPWMTCSRS
jgi:hypothetical protein